MGKKGAEAPSTSTGIVQVSATMNMAIPPFWAMDPMASVLEQLDTLVMRFVPQLEGVLLAHADAKLLSKLGSIDGDSAFAEVPVRFTCFVWRPEVGMSVKGTITLSSPSHVSLLLYDTFNAAVSAPHIPADAWEFVHYSDVGESQRQDAKDRSVGFWQNKETGQRLGGQDNTLTFCVISMTVANQMLSLHGSLLSDPFSVPPPQPGTMSFDQAIGSTEPMEEEKTEETAPKPRRVRWEDSDEEAEEVVQQAAVADDAVDDHQAEAQDEEDAPLVEAPTQSSEAPKEADSDKKEKKEKRKDKKSSKKRDRDAEGGSKKKKKRHSE